MPTNCTVTNSHEFKIPYIYIYSTNVMYRLIVKLIDY